METKIYNLSFDIPEKLIGSKTAPNSLTRERLMEFLVKEGILSYENSFSVKQNGIVNDRPTIIYAVKTTIIFHSIFNRAEICKKLSRFHKNMYYVITEVKEDEKLYLGTMHADDELMDNCNLEIWKIIEDLNSNN